MGRLLATVLRLMPSYLRLLISELSVEAAPTGPESSPMMAAPSARNPRPYLLALDFRPRSWSACPRCFSLASSW
jgi:hypothetical protein